MLILCFLKRPFQGGILRDTFLSEILIERKQEDGYSLCLSFRVGSMRKEFELRLSIFSRRINATKRSKRL